MWAMPIVICATLVFGTTLLHYEALRLLSALIPRLSVSGRLRVLVGIIGTFIAHIFEITLYALAYYLLRDSFGLGNFGGNFDDTFRTFLYFSGETFTSVGLGDIYPTGAMRLLCGIEALNGLLLIGWSASFTYVYMSHFWQVDEVGKP